jgi:predicted RNA-binding protein with PIN domain
MRTIILDGYNVILRSPAFRPDERRDLEAAREKLVNLLSWAVGTQGEARFVLVFDGADAAGQPKRRTAGVRDASGKGRVDVRFSTPPQKADDLIRELVDAMADDEIPVTVVTSDLEVARDARAKGATIVFSDLFAASLFEDPALKAKATAKAKAAGSGAKPGSPTAEGSDAEAKPEGLSKKQAAEWLRLFEEQRKNEELH